MQQESSVCEIVQDERRWSKRKALAFLGLCTILIAIESEFLVSGIEPVTEALNWSDFLSG